MKNLLSRIKTLAEDNPHFIFSLFAFILTISVIVLCFSFPASAADEPFEGGQSAAPTDLIGTSWTIPSGWSAPAGTGIYTVSAHVSIDRSILPNVGDISYLSLGYYASSSNQRANSIILGGVTTLDSNSYGFTITFTAGTDLSNSSLISWLMANGTWTNPPEPEPEPTPTYTIQPNYYQIKLHPDMIPDDVGFYEYGGQFIYEGETYRSLRFSRVSSLLTNVYLYDDDGNQVVIKGQTASNDGWFSGRNITLVSSITTENEEAYTYFTENLSATEQSPFDLVTYMISGFFKALDNFYIFFDFTLLDFIFVMCGLFAAIWFLKLLAGG